MALPADVVVAVVVVVMVVVVVVLVVMVVVVQELVGGAWLGVSHATDERSSSLLGDAAAAMCVCEHDAAPPYGWRGGALCVLLICRTGQLNEMML